MTTKHDESNLPMDEAHRANVEKLVRKPTGPEVKELWMITGADKLNLQQIQRTFETEGDAKGGGLLSR
ncbi:hypothetical protein [Leptolyngbya sp. FACHB-16]|uniref:hypothetical protein n=1 Tax=unclassified Leptolyngbya TaxID=2650499 RepID=UPI001681E1C8|nr:hypothetical protein [Leptolyngbya sp. FACHB-16]MBD2152912.1 hypothetical protein [Leptolyngbya sp. FACHB-16]